MCLIAGKPSEEVSEHQAITFQVTDDRLDTVSPVLLIRMGLAPSPPLAGDMNLGEECDLTATVAPVSQQMLRHLAGVRKGPLKRRVDRMAILGITGQGLAIKHKALFGRGHHADLGTTSSRRRGGG